MASENPHSVRARRSPDETKARKGRPPTIVHADIVRAALDIGLDRADVRNVAEALGISLQGLYHHVKSREELISKVTTQLFADMFQSFGNISSFWDAVRFYAVKVFEMFSTNPRAITSISTAALATQPAVTENLIPWMAELSRHGAELGLTPEDCMNIFAIISGSAMGAAIVESYRRHLPDLDSESVGGSTKWVLEIDAFAGVEATLVGLEVRYSGATTYSIPI
jgi:AcrR family transcriptional regulator